MSGISLIKEIYKILTKDDKLMKMVNSQIYPVVSEIDVKYPYVIFGKRGITPNYNKGGIRFDSVNVNFLVVAKTYAESVDIAERIRLLLELKKDDYILQTKLMNVADDYDFQSDAYAQDMNFVIDVAYKK